MQAFCFPWRVNIKFLFKNNLHEKHATKLKTPSMQLAVHSSHKRKLEMLYSEPATMAKQPTLFNRYYMQWKTSLPEMRSELRTPYSHCIDNKHLTVTSGPFHVREIGMKARGSTWKLKDWKIKGFQKCLHSMQHVKNPLSIKIFSIFVKLIWGFQSMTGMVA